ncbi:Exodeoxyribonuclease VII small subunit [Lachnospiraceae bacterium KH1T2]|nr:Exodeoxyribonuclease VII small subunit [Lachnospiraceae bacterium KH1T2]
MSPAKKKELTIEEGFKHLEDAVQKMDSEDISLEESFAVYEKAMQVLKSTRKKIDEVEKKVMVVNDNGDREEFQ